MKRITNSILTLLLTLVLTGCLDDDDDDEMMSEETVTTIVDAAVADGRFTTLVTALQTAGLDATLSDTNASFTVFAPTDDAFGLLGADAINALLADTDQLTSVLTYHVLSGEVDATAAVASAGMEVETVNGANIALSLDGNDLLVNTSTVIITDIMTDNGIIHVIDAVLMPPQEMMTPTMNIVETAVADGRFTTLVTALTAAGLDSVLADEAETFTVFAPTDDAFAMIDENLLEGILADSEALNAILLQHVVQDLAVGSVTAFSLNGNDVETASGAMIPLAINSTTDMLTFGGANVIIKDIYTTNGVIHVIDTVVVGDVELPDPILSINDVAEAAGSFTTLLAALEATDLISTLDDDSSTFTVFAPTDAAFALLGQETIDDLLAQPDVLRNILLYHVVAGQEILGDAAVAKANSDMKMLEMANETNVSLSLTGSQLFVNTSAVSDTNVMAANGVIHVIDQVILPPAEMTTTTDTIVDVAVNDPDNFSILVDALTAADLVTTLDDETATFTVFAPTNAAFDKIPDDTLSALLANQSDLTTVLTQHVIPNAAIDSLTAFAANGATVETVAENNLGIEIVNFTSFTDTTDDEVAYDATNQMLVGGMGSGMAGMTLYVFDNDLGSDGSECNDTCASNWPPVLVTDGMPSPLPGLGMVSRDDGSMQVTYQGRPLYFYAGDSAVGDMNGQGANDVWWTVEQPQVSLQVQGSNVTMYDIYTANGVIHVIDTVITSAQ